MYIKWMDSCQVTRVKWLRPITFASIEILPIKPSGGTRERFCFLGSHPSKPGGA